MMRGRCFFPFPSPPPPPPAQIIIIQVGASSAACPAVGFLNRPCRQARMRRIFGLRMKDCPHSHCSWAS